MPDPFLPAALFGPRKQAHLGLRNKCFPPVAVGGGALHRQFVVAGAHHAEGIVVKAKPDVQSVFFDASGRAAAGGAFAAQSPAFLIDRDGIATTMFGARQLECRRHAAAPPTDHRDFDGFVQTTAPALTRHSGRHPGLNGASRQASEMFGDPIAALRWTVTPGGPVYR